MDAILEIPMQDVLDKVPIDQQTKAVLLGGASCLRPLYQLVLARESGDWENTSELTKQLHLTDRKWPRLLAGYAVGPAGQQWMMRVLTLRSLKDGNSTTGRATEVFDDYSRGLASVPLLPSLPGQD